MCRPGRPKHVHMLLAPPIMEPLGYRHVGVLGRTSVRAVDHETAGAKGPLAPQQQAAALAAKSVHTCAPRVGRTKSV